MLLPDPQEAASPRSWLPALVLVLIVAMLFGCAVPPPMDPSKMTAEQITAAAKDRSALAICTTVNSPWGVGRTVHVQLDKATIPDGDVSVATDCAVTVRTNKAAAPKPPP